MDNEQLIQKYLHGQISAEEQKLLLERLEKDEDLKEQFEIESVFYAQRNVALKKELTESASNIIGEKKDGIVQLKRRSFKSLAVAASVLALAALAAIMWSLLSPANENQYQALVNDYLEVPFEAPPILLNGSNNASTVWGKAMSSYKKNDFENAASMLSTIPKRTEQQDLYLGLCYLFSDSNQALNSIPHFEQVLAAKDDTYKDIALWYAALSNAKSNQKNKASVYLQQIIDKESWNHVKANKLLKELTQ